MADDFDSWDDDPFGGDLDFDDDFDKPKAGFIRSFATGFLSGVVGKTVGDTDARVNTLKMVLPNTWLGAFSNVAQLNQRRREVMEEIKGDSYQTVQDLQYLAKRAGTKLGKGGPNKISDQLMKFSSHDFSDWEKTDFSEGDSTPRMEDVSEDQVKMAMEASEANSLLERNTMETIADRTMDMMAEVGGRTIGSMNTLNRSLVRNNQLMEQLLDHQRRVQARSDAMQLNVMTRMYLTNAKYYKFQEAAQHRVISELKSIREFSKMSDYEKTSHSQAIRKEIRSQFFSSVKSKFGGISEFINDKFGKDARSDTIGAVGDVVGSLRMATEMTEGMTLNLGDIAGNAAAGLFISQLPRIMKSGRAREYLAKFKKNYPKQAKWAEDAYKRMEDLGNVATYTTGNAAGLVNAMQRHYVGGMDVNGHEDYDEYLASLPPGAKPTPKLEWEVLNTLKKTANKGLGSLYENSWSNSGSRYSLTNRTLADSYEQTHWSRRSDRTLNEIIPQWMSQIHLSLEKIRTGEDKLKPMSYDYVKARFITHDQKVNNVVNKVLDRNSFSSVAQSSNNITDTIDQLGLGALSPEAKKALSMELIMGSDKEEAFTPWNFLKLDEHAGVSPKVAAEIRRAMKAAFDITDKHIADFETGSDANRIKMAGYLPTEKARKNVVGVADAVKSLGNLVPDIAAQLDIHKGTGSYDALKESGLIVTDEYNRDDINMDMIKDAIASYIADPNRRNTKIPDRTPLPTRPGSFGGFPYTVPTFGNRTPVIPGEESPEGVKVQGMDKLTESLASMGDLKTAINNMGGPGNPLAQMLNLDPLNAGMTSLNEQVKRLVEMGVERNDLLTRILHNQPGSGKPPTSEDKHDISAGKRSIIERLKATNLKDMFNKGVDKLLDAQPLVLGGLLGGLAAYAIHDPKAAALLGGGAAVALAYGKIHSMSKTRAALDSEDLYEEGSDTPILEANKLANRNYYDATKGFLITSWKQITGSVKDKTNDTIIGARRLAGKLFTKENKEVLLSGLSKIRDFAMRAFKWVDPFGRAVALKDRIVNRFHQMDVYKEGEKSPVLVGKRFAAGEYWKRGEGGEAVQLTGWHEIDGPVYDKNGDIIITQEEYDRGLRTSMGVSVNKLGAASKKLGEWGLDLFNKAREKAGPAFGKAKDATVKAFKADYSPIVNSVDRIYHLLLKHWGYALEMPGATVDTPVGDENVNVPVTSVKPPKLKVKLKTTASAPSAPQEKLEIPKGAQQAQVSPEELERREAEDAKPKDASFGNVAEQIKARIRKQLGEQPEENNRLNSRADKLEKAKEKKAEDAQDALIKMSQGMGFFGGGGKKEKKESQGIFGLLKDGLGAIAGGIFGLTKFFTGTLWNSFKTLGTFANIGIKVLPFMATGIAAIAKGIYTLVSTGSLTGAGVDTFDHLRGKKRTKAERAKQLRDRKAPRGRVAKGGMKVGAGLAVGLGVDALVNTGFIDEGGALNQIGDIATTATTVIGGYQMATGVAAAAGVDIGLGAMATAATPLLAGAWTTMAPLLLNPYVLAAVAVGAIGYGIYRYVKRGSGKQFDLRMTQYGVSDPDSDLGKKILQIEEKLTNYVVIGNGRASFSKDAPLQEILQAFITDPKDKQQLGSIFSWFNGRFKPVYLTYMACLDVVKLKSLKDYDDAVSQDVYKVAKQVHQTLGSVMPFPYSIVAKIDPDTPLLGEKTTVVRCNNLLEELKKYIDRKTDTSADAEAIKTPQGVEAMKKEQAALQAVLAQPRGFFDSNDKLQAVIKAQDRLNEIDTQLAQLNGGYKVSKVVGEVFIKDLLPDNRPVDMLTGIRLACYGNDQDLTWRVEAVLKLERYCESLIVIADGGAQFKGQVGDMFGIFKEAFRLDKGDADNWCRWFKDRFMPTLLNYFNLIQNYRRGNPGVVWRSLSVTARYEIAKALVETKVEPGAGLIVPIWNVRAAPFKDAVSPGKPDRVDRMLDVLGEASTTAKLKDPEKEAGKTNTQSWAKAISPHKTGGDFTTKRANVDDVSKARNSRDVGLGGQYGTNTSRGSGTGNTYNLGGAYQTPGNSYGYQPLTGDSDTSHLDLSGVQAADGQDNGVKVPKQLAEQLIIREMLKQGFTDPRAIAEMLALTNYETEGFGRTVENMRYTTPENLLKTFREVTSLAQARALVAAGPVAIANTVYGGGKGQTLGNIAPGDGWKYRGRGLVQLTGRAQYARIGQQLGIDLVNNPELASNDPNVMAAIAVNFYKNSKLLQSITQDGNFGRAATGLNGGNELPGMPKRFQLYTSYLQQLQSGQLKADDAAAQGTNQAPSQGAGSMYGGGGSNPAPTIGTGNTPQIGAAPGGGSRNAGAYSTPPSLMAPGGGGADYSGNYGNGAPSEPGSLVGGGTGINSSGLRLKSGEAIAGGDAHPGIIRLCQLIQSQVPNFRYFSALNDAFHKNKKPNSKHALGLALDFTLTNGATGAGQAMSIVAGILRTANMGPNDFLLLNEYAKASAGATGGHVHVGFKSKEAADKFAQAAGAAQPAGQDTTAGGTVTAKDQAYDPGQMPSTPPDTTTVPTPAMKSNAPAPGGNQVAPGAGGGAIPGPYTSLPLPGQGGSTENPNGPVAAPGSTPQGSKQPLPEGYGKPVPKQQATAQQPAPADPGGLMEKLTTVVGEGTGKQDTTNQLLQQIAGLLKSMESNSKPASPAVTI
jgi:predicted chitinase/cell division protein FtsB